MEPFFSATYVEIPKRRTQTNEDGLKEQEVEIKVQLTSSGNVEGITSNELALRILKALEHV